MAFTFSDIGLEQLFKPASSSPNPLEPATLTKLLPALLIVPIFLASVALYILCKPFLIFFYNCFLKPHAKGSTSAQQDALESFYSGQAAVYDATRAKLLRGREEMLKLAAAQLKLRDQNLRLGADSEKLGMMIRGRVLKRDWVWVDVCISNHRALALARVGLMDV